MRSRNHNVFYREAGPATAPTIVLLHGFPSSSNMFRNLIPELQQRYHVIAPDYPGFGHSDAPERTKFRYDYRTNVELYPRFHAFFRERQPPTLIVWGNNDKIFPGDGARAYVRDLPRAELHLLDTGHFALEDQGPEIARLMLDFLDRRLASR